MNDMPLQELIERVEAFEIDEGAPSLSFARRLARENGWTEAYAHRVVREYKRFAILAIAAGHPVTPSEDVDQAWHLHLTYTRSYWDRFCRGALETPLHHNPTEGGLAEHAKFFEWYANTLASYELLFGDAPPSDIWPHASRRFAHAGASRWIDPTKCWIIPKLRLHLRRGIATTFVVVLTCILLVVAGCGPQVDGTMNPFDFKGDEFLVFYFVLIAGGVATSFWIRMSSDGSDVEGLLARDWQAADPYVIAALANGPRGVVFAAIASLFARGSLKLIEPPDATRFRWLRTKSQRLVRGEPLPAGAPEIERVLVAAADETGDVRTQQIVEAGLTVAQSYREPLRAEGLVEPERPDEWSYRTLPTLILGSVFGIGLVKAAVGLARDKPIGFLVLLLVAVVVLIAYFLLSKRYLTSKGRKLVALLREQNQHLVATNDGGTPPSIHDFVLATALFGAITWRNRDGGFAELYELLRKDRAFQGAGDPGGAGCGGGGCGGGGGGGCGGGCGGCGGGGD